MKILLISLLFLLPAAVHARQPLPDGEIDRAVAAAKHRESSTWQTQLAYLQTRYEQVRCQSYCPPQRQILINNDLDYSSKAVYFTRITALQQSVRHNAALAGYTFVAPIAQELADFSSANYEALQAFLQGSHALTVQTRYVESFTLAVQIRAGRCTALELWINAATKKIYLMSNNFSPTCDGKYNLRTY